MRIGYARVSTADQNPDLQEDALQKAGCEKLFRDIASGAADSRKGLSEAIEYARDGETLVVWKQDRLGRSLKHLIETVARRSPPSRCISLPEVNVLDRRVARTDASAEDHRAGILDRGKPGMGDSGAR